MADILIEKKNESFITITGEQSTLQEMQDYFTFFADGYKFNPKYKAKIWDGKIRLLKITQRNRAQIYYGLLSQIINFCGSRDYTYELGSSVKIKPNTNEEELKEYLKHIEEGFAGSNIEIRDYQYTGYTTSLLRKRQLILSPTSSGKSLAIYLIVKYLVDKGMKGLIVVPTVSLVHQITDNFKEYSAYNGWDAESNIHNVYTGQEKTTEKLITISTWQSLHNIKTDSFFAQYDFVIVDEVHNAKAASLTNILEKCINASYRIGLTGTLDGLKVNEKTLIGLFGPINKLITTKELMDRKQVAAFNIKCLVLKYDKETNQALRKYKYQDEIKYLVTNKKRNNFIKNLAFSLDKNTIILFNFVETHGKVIYDLLQNSKHRNGRNIYFIHGGIAGEERERIRKIMEKETNAIIVASSGTMSTGVSIKNLHNIIFAISGKSRIRNLQSIGRVLRLHEDKEIATLYDIADNLSIGKHQNFSLLHLLERIKIYNQEQFDYKIITVDFPQG
jgi:superfamily II DNA or RNA helicase